MSRRSTVPFWFSALTIALAGTTCSVVGCGSSAGEGSARGGEPAPAGSAGTEAAPAIPSEAIPKTSTPRAASGSSLVGLSPTDAARADARDDAAEATGAAGSESGASPDPTLAAAVDEQLRIDAKARTAFGDALGEAFLTSDLEAIGRWTRFGSRPLAKRCKDLESPREEELEARISHCAKVIPWATLENATLTGGERRGPHAECDPDIDALSRIRIVLASGPRRFHLDVLDPVADASGILGFGGHITCSEVKVSPTLTSPPAPSSDG